MISERPGGKLGLETDPEKPTKNSAFWADRARLHGSGLAATASTSWVRNAVLRRLRTAIKKMAGPTVTVLEVGCGNASSLLSPLSRDWLVYGADLTQEMLILAKKHHPGLAGLVCSDACYLPFRDKCFDVVYTSRCLVNVMDADLQRLAISEIFRVAKQDALVVLIENFEESVARMHMLKQRWHAGTVDIDKHNLRLNFRGTLAYARQLGWREVSVQGNTLTSFLAQIVVAKIIPGRGASFADRCLYPVYRAFSWLEDWLGAWLPLFGKDTMVIFKRATSESQ